MAFIIGSFGLFLGLISASADTLAAPAPDPVHAIAMHGEPLYSEDYNHFDYVNPQAPKGWSGDLFRTWQF
jgi:ABC-type oligopeptide transport system substrate-binding subunit